MADSMSQQCGMVAKKANIILYSSSDHICSVLYTMFDIFFLNPEVKTSGNGWKSQKGKFRLNVKEIS